MVTGDGLDTASAIAHQIGLADRFSPKAEGAALSGMQLNHPF